ncbi:MAG: hypothetical protein HYU77_08565 [Betaproteobacteria bacterium]|nr:hypothetical protein [Betaproteobacteria bacterium]
MKAVQLSVAKFEQLVSSRQHGQALRYLIAILSACESGRLFATDAMGEEKSLQFHTRLAAAAGSLLLEPDLSLSGKAYEQLAVLNRDLSQIFAASGFGSTGHLLPLIETPGGGAKGTAIDDRRRRFLAATTLESMPGKMAEFLERCSPELALPIVLGLLAARMVLTPAATEHRRQLLALGPVIERGALTDALVPPLASAWMLCSYADAPGKHGIKVHLNRLVRRWLAEKGVADRDLPAPRSVRQRPTLLVAAEQLVSTHAMYRCYASFIRQLGQKFRMVMMAGAADADDRAKSLFDEVIQVPDRLDIGRIAALAGELEPDLIYFPSLGMRPWTVVMANLRLAPIQFFTLGHPATSQSSCIDYVLMGRDILGNPDCFSERIVLLQSPGSLYEMRHDAPGILPELRERPDPVRIAVPARGMKITAAFLDLCAEIEEKAKGSAEFHFFPNFRGTLHCAISRQIRNRLPRAIAHPSKSYGEYIGNLNRCDLALSTFPFGNACSTIDALGQGIPVVSFQGPEPHSRTDLRIQRAMGLPEWLCARDAASFRDAALRLIGDHGLRLELSTALVEKNVDQTLFDEEHGRHPTDFVDTVWWLYEHHDLIRNDPRKVWEPEIRETLIPQGADE